MGCASSPSQSWSREPLQTPGREDLGPPTLMKHILGSVVRVGICDDDAEVRELLHVYLCSDPTLEWVVDYPSAQEVERRLDSDTVDVLLLDVRMPGVDGPTLARRLHERGVGCRVLFLTSYPGELDVDRERNSTVVGALVKSTPPARLTQAIHLAAAGIRVLGEEFQRLEGPGRDARRSQLAPDPKERRVLDLLCEGRSNAEIAEATFRSVSSVKQILSAIMQRAGVKSRTQLLVYAYGERVPTKKS